MHIIIFCALALLLHPRRPEVYLWAWERPEDLRFVEPGTAGVAFLARTVSLRNGAIEVHPRMQPLRYRPGTSLVAVVRVEASGTPLPEPGAAAAAILPASRIQGVHTLQIDFDARLSERVFYRQLLTELRRRMPPGMPLSITALASWCESDRWLNGLPVDEAVPMLFRMGVNQGLKGDREPLCRSSLGVSTDEFPPPPVRGRRVYIFNPHSWTRDDFRAALREVSR